MKSKINRKFNINANDNDLVTKNQTPFDNGTVDQDIKKLILIKKVATEYANCNKDLCILLSKEKDYEEKIDYYIDKFYEIEKRLYEVLDISYDEIDIDNSI